MVQIPEPGTGTTGISVVPQGPSPLRSDRYGSPIPSHLMTLLMCGYTQQAAVAHCQPCQTQKPRNPKLGCLRPRNPSSGACAPETRSSGACTPETRSSGACAPETLGSGACTASHLGWPAAVLLPPVPPGLPGAPALHAAGTPSEPAAAAAPACCLQGLWQVRGQEGGVGWGPSGPVAGGQEGGRQWGPPWEGRLCRILRGELYLPSWPLQASMAAMHPPSWPLLASMAAMHPPSLPLQASMAAMRALSSAASWSWSDTRERRRSISNRSSVAS